MTGIFLAFGAFFLKHFVVDFLLQPRWMFANKHRLGHPGGLAHAALHGLVTFTILYALLGLDYAAPSASLGLAGGLALAEAVIHYGVDWTKMNVTRWQGWKPDSSPWFWYSLGADQFSHYMTYLILLMLWF